MEWWLPVLSVAGSLAVVAGGYLANRKLGIAEGQKALVQTLKDTVTAQDDRIEQLERVESECKAKLRQHELRIAGLESAMTEIGRENHKLHVQLDQWEASVPSRRPPRRPRRSDPA